MPQAAATSWQAAVPWPTVARAAVRRALAPAGQRRLPVHSGPSIQTPPRDSRLGWRNHRRRPPRRTQCATASAVGSARYPSETSSPSGSVLALRSRASLPRAPFALTAQARCPVLVRAGSQGDVRGGHRDQVQQLRLLCRESAAGVSRGRPFAHPVPARQEALFQLRDVQGAHHRAQQASAGLGLHQVPPVQLEGSRHEARRQRAASRVRVPSQRRGGGQVSQPVRAARLESFRCRWWASDRGAPWTIAAHQRLRIAASNVRWMSARRLEVCTYTAALWNRDRI